MISYKTLEGKQKYLNDNKVTRLRAYFVEMDGVMVSYEGGYVVDMHYNSLGRVTSRAGLRRLNDLYEVFKEELCNPGF